MATNKAKQLVLSSLKKKYLELVSKEPELNQQITEAEISEIVYNSNAIENSTITLIETSDILNNNQITRKVDLREIYEVKNLANVLKNISSKTEITVETILKLHKILLTYINDEISGRFRKGKEYVRVGSHLAPPPEFVEGLIQKTILEYISDDNSYFLDKIAKFHLEFEFIHPFVDGNGRIGRVLINLLLSKEAYPPIIIKDRGKEKYYRCFQMYDVTLKTGLMEELIYRNLTESLNKRISILSKLECITVSEYSKIQKINLKTLLNKAQRQTIPAFRINGVWYIPSRFRFN